MANERSKLAVPAPPPDGPEEVIDDTFPPFTPLTHVRTIAPNLQVGGEMPPEERNTRRWGIEAIVLDAAPDNPKWFLAQHCREGSTARYHFSEMRCWREGDSDNDDDGGDDEPPPNPEEPVPCLEPEDEELVVAGVH